MSTSNRIKGKNAVSVSITFGIISPSAVIAATLILANINRRPIITNHATISAIVANWGLDMGGAVIVTIGVAIVIILTELFGKGGKH